jgi:hypothetical protein
VPNKPPSFAIPLAWATVLTPDDRHTSAPTSVPARSRRRLQDGAFMEPSGRNRGPNGGNGAPPKTAQTSRNRWQPTATVSERMVRRGSPTFDFHRWRLRRDVVNGDIRRAYKCAYRLVSKRCSLFQFVATMIGRICSAFQFRDVRFSLFGRTFNPKVVGSIPTRPTCNRARSPFVRAGVVVTRRAHRRDRGVGLASRLRVVVGAIAASQD